MGQKEGRRIIFESQKIINSSSASSALFLCVLCACLPVGRVNGFREILSRFEIIIKS
jgi:hypothetical protein